MAEQKKEKQKRVEWFSLQVWGGKEMKVRDVIEKTCANNERLRDAVKQVLVPTEKRLVTTPSGNKTVKDSVLMSGYVYVQCELVLKVTAEEAKSDSKAKAKGKAKADQNADSAPEAVQDMVNVEAQGNDEAAAEAQGNPEVGQDKAQESKAPNNVIVKREWVMDPELEALLRGTTNVFGVVGPIPASDIEGMLGHAEQKSEQLVDAMEYSVGDKVKVTSGPFSGFVGDVSEVNGDKHELTVIVKVFGRETPLNLDNSKVERAGV